MKLSNYQLSQMLKLNNLTDTEEDILDEIHNKFDDIKNIIIRDDLIIYRDRYRVFWDLFHKGAKSDLVKAVMNDLDYFAVVSDSVVKGLDGLFVIMCTENLEFVKNFLDSLVVFDSHTREIDSFYISLTPIKSLITKR